MSALLQTQQDQVFGSFKAIGWRLRPHIAPAHEVLAPSQRTYPESLTQPTLPPIISENMINQYADIFCHGGFRQMQMTFEQFLLVAATIKPADFPETG